MEGNPEVMKKVLGDMLQEKIGTLGPSNSRPSKKQREAAERQ
jgi:hypothetical protein